jgi:hypothetical protein
MADIHELDTRGGAVLLPALLLLVRLLLLPPPVEVGVATGDLKSEGVWGTAWAGLLIGGRARGAGATPGMVKDRAAGVEGEGRERGVGRRRHHTTWGVGEVAQGRRR